MFNVNIKLDNMKKIRGKALNTFIKIVFIVNVIEGNKNNRISGLGRVDASIPSLESAKKE